VSATLRPCTIRRCEVIAGMTNCCPREIRTGLHDHLESVVAFPATSQSGPHLRGPLYIGEQGVHGEGTLAAAHSLRKPFGNHDGGSLTNDTDACISKAVWEHIASSDNFCLKKPHHTDMFGPSMVIEVSLHEVGWVLKSSARGRSFLAMCVEEDYQLRAPVAKPCRPVRVK
jgi:hypothetical protein